MYNYYFFFFFDPLHKPQSCHIFHISEPSSDRIRWQTTFRFVSPRVKFEGVQQNASSHKHPLHLLPHIRSRSAWMFYFCRVKIKTLTVKCQPFLFKIFLKDQCEICAWELCISRTFWPVSAEKAAKWHKTNDSFISAFNPVKYSASTRSSKHLFSVFCLFFVLMLWTLTVTKIYGRVLESRIREKKSRNEEDFETIKGPNSALTVRYRPCMSLRSRVRSKLF